MFGWKRRRQLLQEFEEHIELETLENIRAGMAPEAARQAAKKKFGSELRAVEQAQQVWGEQWVERLAQDVRYAVRSLRGAPAYTATLVCALVLGLGCATTMLAIIQSTLVRPVALPHSEQLVQISGQDRPEGTSVSSYALSYGAIDELRQGSHSFSGVSRHNTTVRPVTAPDGTRITPVVEVTPEFFQVLELQPRYGRFFQSADKAGPVAVVSSEFWVERLHGDPSAVGSAIKVSGTLRTVIGVLPAGVHVPLQSGAPVVYIPIVVAANGEDEFKMDSASVLARLKPGVSAQQALADAQAVFAHSSRKDADHYRHLIVQPWRDLVVGDIQKPLLSLLGAVGVLLLIALANAANLQIGRAAGRLPEMAVRSALGASFGRILQQLVTEGILIAMVSATFAGALSYAAVALLRHTFAGEFPRFDELAIRPAVLICTAVLAVAVGLLSSVAPALNIRRWNTVRLNVRPATRKSRLPGVLVVVQIALTCVLLVVGGLFLRTLQQLQNVRLGFDPQGVTTLVLMPESQNQDPIQSRQVETRLLERFQSLPGVQAVAMQSEVPFSSYNISLNGTTEITGRPFQKGDSAFYSVVSSNFVQTSRIRLVNGRGFIPQDDNAGAMVVLVNEAFVQKYLGGRQPLGATLRFHRNPGETDQDLPFVNSMSVVGVVENEQQGGELGAPFQPMVYIDLLQLPRTSFLNMVFNMTGQYAIRSNLGPAALASELRQAIRQEAPGMAEMSLRPMQEAISESLGQRRLALRLVSAFGLVALALSAIGIYGVLAYSVALRQREIGIRMALGSSRSKIAGLVVRQAGSMLLLGLVPGLLAAWAAGHAIRSFLYGVKTLDLQAVAGAGLVLLLVAAASALFPALRAAQVDPVETLRAE